MNHADFLKTLKSDVPPEQQRLLNDLHSGKKIEIIAGAFGPETPSSDAYIDEIIRPAEGGHMYKFYGCSYLFKGTYDVEKVHGIQLAKSLLSKTPFAFLRNLPIALSFLFMYIFRRQRLLVALSFLMHEIDERVMKWYDIPENDYNAFTKEIKRAVKESLGDNLWSRLIWQVVKFVCLIIEIDSAYRLRLQDSIAEAFNRFGKITIFNVLDILVEREAGAGAEGNNMVKKWRRIKLMILVLLWLSPELNTMIEKIFSELNAEKIRMDESDWYFSLQFKSYNFGGKSFECRLDEKAHLDKQLGHVFLI